MNRKVKFGIILVILCLAVLVVGVIIVSAAFHSDSVYITTVYPFMPEVIAVWQPSLLPGWQLDGSQNCIGQMRVNVNTYICDYTHFYINEQWTFIFMLPAYICGKSNVSLQPFLLVYNPTTRVHDAIYGEMIIDNHFSLCHAVFLPAMSSDGRYSRLNLSGKLAPYPSPYP